jgi:phosphinothricin acetyltransferase
MLKRACPEATVVGLDGDPEILTMARAKATAAGVDIELHHGMAFAPPFAPASFDRIVSSLVFHHLGTDDKRRTLVKARELLRPGGELHIADWGQPQNVLMRVAFLGVQLVDGFTTTSDSVHGRLISFMRAAGFTAVAETHREMTIFGTLSLYRAVAGAGAVPYCIGPMQERDWEHVRAIYIEGIATGEATFETDAPSWERWNATHLAAGRLVARCGDALLGWVALIPVSERCVYAGVAEVSVYVASRHRGHGVGGALLQALITASEQHGIWTLQAGIFPENQASVALVKKVGFREIGRRERLGKLHGTWRDVLLFERRSNVAGVG